MPESILKTLKLSITSDPVDIGRGIRPVCVLSQIMFIYKKIIKEAFDQDQHDTTLLAYSI